VSSALLLRARKWHSRRAGCSASVPTKPHVQHHFRTVALDRQAVIAKVMDKKYDFWPCTQQWITTFFFFLLMCRTRRRLPDFPEIPALTGDNKTCFTSLQGLILSSSYTHLFRWIALRYWFSHCFSFMRNKAVTQMQYVYGLFERSMISLNSSIDSWDIEINECYAASWNSP